MKLAKQLTNWNNGTAQFGVTKFADLSPQEFRDKYLMKNFPKDSARGPLKTVFPPRPGYGPDPTNFDWSEAGVITPIYNQGECGSCWAFSATETIESYNALAGNGLTQLSMEQIVDCDVDGSDQGCNGGFPTGAYSYVQSAGGIESYADYPYTAEDGYAGSCQYNQADDVCTVAGYESLGGEPGEYSQLSSAGPVSVCVDASSWQFYQGGVLTTCTTNVDHCVQLTGYYNYGSAFPQAYWNVRNSWGVDWGISGYIWIAIGQNLCAIGEYPTIVSTTPV